MAAGVAVAVGMVAVAGTAAQVGVGMAAAGLEAGFSGLLHHRSIMCRHQPTIIRRQLTIRTRILGTAVIHILRVTSMDTLRPPSHPATPIRRRTLTTAAHPTNRSPVPGGQDWLLIRLPA